MFLYRFSLLTVHLKYSFENYSGDNFAYFLLDELIIKLLCWPFDLGLQRKLFAMNFQLLKAIMGLKYIVSYC